MNREAIENHLLMLKQDIVNVSKRELANMGQIERMVNIIKNLKVRIERLEQIEDNK